MERDFKQEIYNANPNNDKTISAVYQGQKDLFTTTVAAGERYVDRLESATDKVIAAKEQGAMARVETFSDEKGKQLNQQYGQYIEGSVAESFAIKTQLFEERQQLMMDISQMRLQIKEEKMEAELEIRKQKQEAEFELEQIKKEMKALKKPSKVQKFWNIFCPFLGIGLGALTFVLLFVLI